MYAVFYITSIYDNRDACVGTRTRRDESFPYYQTAGIAHRMAWMAAERAGYDGIDFTVRQLIDGRWVEIEQPRVEWEDIEF